MRFIAHKLAPLLSIAALHWTVAIQSASSIAEEKDVFLYPAPNRQFRAPVHNWLDLQSRNIVMQQREYTCGAASLATLLQFVFNDAITEDKILHASIGKLNREALEDREKNGLSMEDLARGASELGYASAVLELKYEKLQELPCPVIVRLIKDDFKHFVVYRGELDGRVFLADPLRGNVRLPRKQFSEQWDGKVLAVVKRGSKPPTEHALSIAKRATATPEVQAARRSLFNTMP